MNMNITIKTKHAVFSWELKISQKNNLYFIAFYMYVWIKLTGKQRNSKFSWELEQKC